MVDSGDDSSSQERWLVRVGDFVGIQQDPAPVYPAPDAGPALDWARVTEIFEDLEVRWRKYLWCMQTPCTALTLLLRCSTVRICSCSDL